MQKIKLLIGTLAVIIVLAGSWWIWNNFLKETVQPIIQNNRVVIITDKPEYLSDELVKIKIENELEHPVYISPTLINCIMVEVLDEEKRWTPVRTTGFLPCECFPEVECDEKGFSPITEIKPSGLHNLVITPKCFHYLSIGSSHYRVRIIPHIKEKSGGRYYYSNEFVINTEKITIRTDRTEYSQGQDIIATIYNGLPEKIEKPKGPTFLAENFDIEQKVDDEWEKVEGYFRPGNLFEILREKEGISPNDTCEFLWNPPLLQEGVHRIRLQLSTSSQMHIAYSNEFIITVPSYQTIEGNWVLKHYDFKGNLKGTENVKIKRENNEITISTEEEELCNGTLVKSDSPGPEYFIEGCDLRGLWINAISVFNNWYMVTEMPACESCNPSIFIRE